MKVIATKCRLNANGLLPSLFVRLFALEEKRTPLVAQGFHNSNAYTDKSWEEEKIFLPEPTISWKQLGRLKIEVV